VGQHSPIHDHAGSVCGLTILQGRATETLYELMPCGVMAPVSSSSKLVGEYCASQDDDTHVISNYEAETDLVTMHIYAPKLQEIGIYDHEGVKHEDKLARFVGFMGGAGI
jgi:cysteine dioxygenase